jgi:hypothetical protein
MTRGVLGLKGIRERVGRRRMTDFSKVGAVGIKGNVKFNYTAVESNREMSSNLSCECTGVKSQGNV